MKKIAAILAGAALMMGVSTSANALSMRVTDGVNTVTVADNGTGVVAYNGALGNFNINFSNGISAAAFTGGGNPSMMDLVSYNASSNFSSQSKLTIYLTESFSYGVYPDLTALIGGATTGSVEYKTFLDATNVAFGTTTLLTDTIYSGGAFSGSVNSPFLPALNSPYTLTQEIDIIHNAGASSTSFNAVLTPTPEPGTMVLLGAGMLVLAIYGKRRMNKDA